MKNIKEYCGNYESLTNTLINLLGFIRSLTEEKYNEYFGNNIPAFNDFSLSEENDELGVTKYYEMQFDGCAEPYMMRVSHNRNKMKFGRKEAVSVLRAIKNNEELILLFHEHHIVDEGDRQGEFDKTCFKKQYIRGDVACVEQFDITNGQVFTQLYNVDELVAAIEKIEEEKPGLSVISNMSFVSGVAEKANLRPEKTIKALTDEYGAHWVQLYDENGKLLHATRNGDVNLYDTYYNYMVDHNYFLSQEQRREELIGQK